MQPTEIEAIFLSGADATLSPNAASDAVLAEMARICALPAAERGEALEPYLEGWRARSKDPVEIACYLAAAGLTFEEACALDEHVRTRAHADLRRRARNDIVCGIALIVAGVFVFTSGSWIDPHFPVWGVVLLIAAAAGARLLARGLRTQRRITPLPDDVLETDR